MYHDSCLIFQIIGTLAPEWLYDEIKAAQANRNQLIPKPDPKTVEMTKWLYDQLMSSNLIACKCPRYG